VFLFDTVIFSFSRMQKCVTLSVTEAEFVAAVEVVQNMIFASRIIESLGLTVTKPMVIEVDNKGAVVRGLNGSVLQCDVKCKIIIFSCPALLLKLM
jgi:hypothetical protein